MSRVKRVAVSNVRMPRSHRMTFSLPSIVMYSLAWSHSSMVAAMPRLNRTGLCDSAVTSTDLLEQGEVGHVARADLEDVRVGVDDLDVRRVDDLGDYEQAVLVGGLAQELQALGLHALEGVRAGAGLVGAAAQTRVCRAPAQAAATSRICSRLSTEHGPAMIVTRRRARSLPRRGRSRSPGPGPAGSALPRRCSCLQLLRDVQDRLVDLAQVVAVERALVARGYVGEDLLLALGVVQRPVRSRA